MIQRIAVFLFAIVLMIGCTKVEESVLEESTAVAEEEVVNQVEENNEDTSANEEKLKKLAK